MHYFNSIREAFPMCFAIGSQVRLDILEQILEHKVINLDTLAKNLHLTNGALTKHIKLLEDAGLIKVIKNKGKRGYQKQCSINQDKLLIEITSDIEDDRSENFEIPLGLYSDYKVSGLCGMASTKGYIGTRNELSSFLSFQRADTSLIWLEKGKLTYFLPLTAKKRKVEELQLTFEISPDIIGENIKTESDVSFMINNTAVGSTKIYTPDSTRRGFLNPDWYDSILPQSGTLHFLRITPKGTFFDGEKISAQSLNTLQPIEKFTIATADGFILFGKGFGDHNCNIKYSAIY